MEVRIFTDRHRFTALQKFRKFTSLQLTEIDAWISNFMHGFLWNVISHPLQWQFSQTTINSLVPGRSQCDLKTVIFNLALLIGIFKSSYDNVLRWMPQDLTDDKSTLVQVMAWCRQTTSHYLNQCWPWSLTPYGITRPQWVKARAWMIHHIPLCIWV